MGKLIIFPTDTVYGIGCCIDDIENIKKIYAIKHRSLDKPLACLCADEQQIQQIAQTDEVTLKLIRAFLPGPLTIILKAQSEITKKIGYTTIGVRIPDCKETINLLKENGPMLTTSVNESGQVALNSYDEIQKQYGSMVDLILPPTQVSSNIASTVIKIIDHQISVIREGSITLESIKKVIDV